MAEAEFITHTKKDRDVVRFGNDEKVYEIDISFISAKDGYTIAEIVNSTDKRPHPPEVLASVIKVAAANTDVTEDWLMENLDYATLVGLATHIMNYAFGTKSRKN